METNCAAIGRSASERLIAFNISAAPDFSDACERKMPIHQCFINRRRRAFSAHVADGDPVMPVPA